MIENRMMTGNRVDCLYRVSTDKQVDYNDKSQADIPMQRRECHRFWEKMGWTIVHDEQEDGVSGHKVRAENRDKLQSIKERAKQGKFDILLVFMFDRIGPVSYTHLDVYKRQNILYYARMALCRPGAFLSLWSRNIGSASVSYTHLDVYKRQMSYRARATPYPTKSRC